MKRLCDKQWKLETVLITTCRKKLQLIPEEILSGSADTSAQTSLPISLFGGLAKKNPKNT